MKNANWKSVSANLTCSTKLEPHSSDSEPLTSRPDPRKAFLEIRRASSSQQLHLQNLQQQKLAGKTTDAL